MVRVKEHFSKRKFDYISIIVLVAAVTLFLFWVYQWDRISFDVPITYSGNDAATNLVNAKLMEEQAWSIERPRLAAPYTTNAYDFSTCVLHNFDLLTLKLCVKATDAVRGSNLNLYLIYYLSAVIAYFVLRELGIKRWIAVFASLAYAFVPYITGRIVEHGHYQLAEAYFVPLSILLCVWLYEREDVLRLGKGFLKNKRNWLALFFIVLISNNGIVYYPFFTCYLLVLVAIIKLIQTKKFKTVLPSITAIAGIGLVLLMNMIPKVIYNLQNGANAAAVVRGGFTGPEYYGLKLIQLFIPYNSKLGILFADAIENYNRTAPFVTENNSSYMGIMALTGMVILFVYFFRKSNSETGKRMRFLGQMNIFMIFLAAGNGIGTIFAFLVSDSIRGYCRIVVFIAFVSLIGLAQFIQELTKQYNRYIVVGVSVLLCSLCLWEQLPVFEEGVIADETDFHSDKAFVAQIEATVEPGSMIYQMPYHVYPEGGPEREMEDYDLFAGMLHSDTLRWSYGAMKGREVDDYQKSLAELPLDERIAKVRELGFAGIYVDRRAYSNEELAQLESELARLTGSGAMISANGKLSYFNFK